MILFWVRMMNIVEGDCELPMYGNNTPAQLTHESSRQQV